MKYNETADDRCIPKTIKFYKIMWPSIENRFRIELGLADFSTYIRMLVIADLDKRRLDVMNILRPVQPELFKADGSVEKKYLTTANNSI